MYPVTVWCVAIGCSGAYRYGLNVKIAILKNEDVLVVEKRVVDLPSRVFVPPLSPE